MKIPSLAFLPVLALAACATRPAITVTEAGTMPEPGSYRFLGVQPDQSHITAALASRLAASGFSAEDSASLIVQVSQSEPPAKTGLAIVQADELQWLLPPTRSKSRRMRRLVITVTDSATGQEIYRASGSEIYRPKTSDEGEALQRSVLALMP